jgi:hypothetical protein
LQAAPEEITEAPADGVIIFGLYLEVRHRTVYDWNNGVTVYYHKIKYLYPRRFQSVFFYH